VALSTAGAPEGWGRWLLLRRSLTSGELAYYACAGPAGLPLVALVRVAGSRWRVEEAFQAGKGLCGLDQHQVRRWRSWYRWVTLAMLAYAFLVVAAVTEHARHPPPLGLIPLTCNEIQHLFAALACQPAGKPTDHEDHELRWSMSQSLSLAKTGQDSTVGRVLYRPVLSVASRGGSRGEQGHSGYHRVPALFDLRGAGRLPAVPGRRAVRYRRWGVVPLGLRGPSGWPRNLGVGGAAGLAVSGPCIHPERQLEGQGHGVLAIRPHCPVAT
jgi:hypothetical protein